MAAEKGAVAVRVGRPSKTEQGDASARIIEAATELFASRGFAGTSMEQVASQCGAGKDTVYRRFPSKVALFETVVEHAHKRAIARLERLPDVDGDALERLRGLMSELLRINMEPDLIALKRITFSEAVSFEKKSQIPPQPDPIMKRLVDAVSDAQDAGLIAAGDTHLIAGHLIHCLVALPTSAAMLGSDEFDGEEAVRAHFERTWNWLINGVRAGSPA
ncbi:TetR/AcrR family transcriptional regulator [Neorhizobium alkalisoli]|uniref:TetR family transcriptional regulator n=1 Tax=Neorhizobium alkalisoli TaxID=528178 RepID=A0A561QPU2_9HYPH|nr:TetR/AcrR family transcriptional regulator [Neorhizobium alkalisoli]TWF52377.1 TetR family transcriptional regulator [Neorhizobium alkalisoli]